MADPVRMEPPARRGQSIFQVNWDVYRKMMEGNYLFHKEVYGRLRHELVAGLGRPFGFLDIACGDGTATVLALRGVAVARYWGIDQSRAALDLAASALRELPCPVSLVQGDFAETLRGWQEKADVAWIGLSLHHLLRPEKLRLMRKVRDIVAEGGLFLVYENTCRDGETREEWLGRWLLQKPAWTLYDESDWDEMWAHVSNCDFPETDQTWRELGTAAGFQSVRELFRAPTDLFRMYEFR